MAATYSKPTVIPRWADTGTRVLPSSGQRDTGWLFEDPPPYGIENWLQGINGDWWKWIDERLDDGASADEFLFLSPENGYRALAITTGQVKVSNHSAFIPATASPLSSLYVFGREGNASGGGNAIHGVGGTGISSGGAGGYFLGGDSNTGGGTGVEAIGAGIAGHGIDATSSGVGGYGVRAFGGGTNGSGLYAEGVGTGSAFEYTSAAQFASIGYCTHATGYAAHFEGQGLDTNAVQAFAAGDGTGLKATSVTGVGVIVQTGTSSAKGALRILDQTNAPSSADDGDVWNVDDRLFAQLGGVTTQITSTWGSIHVASGGSPSILENVNCASVALNSAVEIRITFDVPFDSSTDYCAQVSNNLSTDQFYVVEPEATYVKIRCWDLSTGAAVSFDDGSIRRFSVTVESNNFS